MRNTCSGLRVHGHHTHAECEDKVEKKPKSCEEEIKRACSKHESFSGSSDKAAGDSDSVSESDTV